jgi:phenylalanyl-tRNA synthetase beta chain
MVKKKDLESLVGKKISFGQMETYLPWVKGELKDFDEKSGEAKIELNDSNRPDLWCTEGIARQIKLKIEGNGRKYPFYSHIAQNRKLKIVVKKGVETIRPFIAACSIPDFVMTEDALVQFIQTQEKLADVFGQKRKLLSIGIYHIDQVIFPLIYKTVSPEEIRFVPLGFEENMTLKEILERHPKGKSYRNVFKNEENLPLFVDQKDTVLSFPPIINSREVGEVKTGDQNLMIEVTGTDLRLVNLVLNILATNLYDRGAKIAPISVLYPFKTPFGKEIVFPMEIDSSLIVEIAEIEKILGESFGMSKIKKALSSYGHKIGKVSGSKFKVTPPPYRDDLLHSVDVIEGITHLSLKCR